MSEISFERKGLNYPRYQGVDWLGIIHEFQGTKEIERAELIGTYSESPDNHFYEIETNKGLYYVYEVDYISGIEYETELIETVLGENIDLIKVKNPKKFEDTGPVAAATNYEKPEDWDEIAEYTTDYSGTASFYFKFLIKKK